MLLYSFIRHSKAILMIGNKESARLSRRRKQAHLTELETQVLSGRGEAAIFRIQADTRVSEASRKVVQEGWVGNLASRFPQQEDLVKYADICMYIPVYPEDN